MKKILIPLFLILSATVTKAGGPPTARGIAITGVPAVARPAPTCKAIDTVEFGLVSDGYISGTPWLEIELIEKYGPPCLVIDLGEVYVERSNGLIREIQPRLFQTEEVRIGTVAVKKQFIYTGNYSSPTTAFTLIDGVVVKKERVNR